MMPKMARFSLTYPLKDLNNLGALFITRRRMSKPAVVMIKRYGLFARTHPGGHSCMSASVLCS
jgi:hypothetical protein